MCYVNESFEYIFVKKILTLLFVLSIFGLFSGSQEPVVWFLRGTQVEPFLLALHNGNSIIFTLSGGFIISIFFWYLLIHLPEAKNRAIIKTNIAIYYQNFKEDTIQILLGASSVKHDSKLVKELCDYKKFKEYFGKNENENWYAALNGLQNDTDWINDLLVELELLSNEVSYVLNNIKFADPKVHTFLKNLSANIFRLNNLSVYSYDQVKYLGNFLFGILAQWSFIDGQRKEDIIQEMIEKI